jgi:GDP-L-fucose synthase
MKVLLTGGRGMVGRNVLGHPTASQHEITAPTSTELDLTDRHATAAYIAKLSPDLIIHAAGKVGGIHANIADPVGFLTLNLDMGVNVVMAARAADVPRLLNLSSSCVYPRAAPNPLREEQMLTGELEPTNEGYALAKIVAARLCDYVSRTSPNLKYRTLVPCNLYGLHDKFSPGVSHLVPAIIWKIHEAKRNGNRSVEIWGDGTARREFMFSQDVADGIWQASKQFDDLPDMMNLGVGIDHSISDYYQTVARVIGWEGEFTFDLSKPSGMKQKLVSVDRQKAFGWMPKTSLEDGIAQTYAHFLENCV